ncbi:MAG: adenine phosphoribosyltransferase [bacterium]
MKARRPARTKSKPQAKAKPRSKPASPAKRTARPSDVVDRSLLEAEVMKRKGYPYVIHPLMDGVPRVQPELLRTWVTWAAQQRDILAGATLLLAPEAMGLPLAAGLSLETGIPYAVIRKRRYDLPGEEVAFAETGYGEAALHINDAWPDDRVVIVDDVVSTGGTLRGILTTLEAMGIKALGVLVFVDKTGKAASVAKQHALPVRAMRAIRVDGDKVALR